MLPSLLLLFFFHWNIRDSDKIKWVEGDVNKTVKIYLDPFRSIFCKSVSYHIRWIFREVKWLCCMYNIESILHTTSYQRLLSPETSVIVIRAWRTGNVGMENKVTAMLVTSLCRWLYVCILVFSHPDCTLDLFKLSPLFHLTLIGLG